MHCTVRVVLSASSGPVAAPQGRGGLYRTVICMGALGVVAVISMGSLHLAFPSHFSFFQTATVASHLYGITCAIMH